MNHSHQEQRGRSPSAPPKHFILGSSPSQLGNADISGLGLNTTLLGDHYPTDLRDSALGGVTEDDASKPGRPHFSQNLSDPTILYSTQQQFESVLADQRSPGHHSLENHYNTEPMLRQLSNQSARFRQQQQQTDQLSSDFLNSVGSSGNGSIDYDLYRDGSSNPIFDTFLMDPSLAMDGGGPPPHQSINPADLMTDANPARPTNPPYLTRHQSSPVTSSTMNQMNYPAAQLQSRHASLAIPAGQQQQQQQQLQGPDFSSMFQGSSFQVPQQRHERGASDAHSDVSSSAAPSPYLTNADSFEASINNHDFAHSPLLASKRDSNLFPESLGIETFSLSDAGQIQRRSPGQSPAMSPRLSPQQGVSPTLGAHFMFNHTLARTNQGLQSGYPASQSDMFGDAGAERFPTLESISMAPPEINIEFAATSQPVESHKLMADGNALIPPDRGRKQRNRAVSDPFAGSTPIARPLNMSQQHHLGSSPLENRNRSLSPFDITAPVASIPSSPSRGGSASSRRSSTSAIPNRDYILDLADPQRPGSGATDGKGKIQKHPATFQCTLCPKRFTRAYNLRSHLRTHTDERPFVCTVCGKAFARQHDRKRHEGLHSGEKKFVCRGELQSSNKWGCGRKFARADALGRHFRSEAGRICIRPLLEEEALERQRAWHECQMMAARTPGQLTTPQVMPPPPPMLDFAGLDAGGQYSLPQAVLAQYPALAQLSWDQIGPAGVDVDEDDLSGRSNYDASSGGEYYDDEPDGSGYMSGPGSGSGYAGSAPNGGWAGPPGGF